MCVRACARAQTQRSAYTFRFETKYHFIKLERQFSINKFSKQDALGSTQSKYLSSLLNFSICLSQMAER